MVELGRRLRTLRKQKNLTQKQLASLISTKNSIISFYENGERIPSPEVIVKLAAVLGVTTDFLLGVERGKAVDVSGLSERDVALVSALVDSLREKKQKE